MKPKPKVYPQCCRYCYFCRKRPHETDHVCRAHPMRIYVSLDEWCAEFASMAGVNCEATHPRKDVPT